MKNLKFISLPFFWLTILFKKKQPAHSETDKNDWILKN